VQYEAQVEVIRTYSVLVEAVACKSAEEAAQAVVSAPEFSEKPDKEEVVVIHIMESAPRADGSLGEAP